MCSPYLSVSHSDVACCCCCCPAGGRDRDRRQVLSDRLACAGAGVAVLQTCAVCTKLQCCAAGAGRVRELWECDTRGRLARTARGVLSRLCAAAAHVVGLYVIVDVQYCWHRTAAKSVVDCCRVLLWLCNTTASPWQLVTIGHSVRPVRVASCSNLKRNRHQERIRAARNLAETRVC